MSGDPVADLEPAEGWVADDVAGELPELRLLSVTLDAAVDKSPPELALRLVDAFAALRAGCAANS